MHLFLPVMEGMSICIHSPARRVHPLFVYVTVGSCIRTSMYMHAHDCFFFFYRYIYFSVDVLSVSGIVRLRWATHYIYINMCIYMCVYVSLCLYLYVWICIHIYVYMHSCIFLICTEIVRVHPLSVDCLSLSEGVPLGWPSHVPYYINI